MDKKYEVTISRDEFNAICDADEDARPIMDLRNRLMDLVKADGEDQEMYDSKFYDGDPIRMTAHFNEKRFKKANPT